MKRHTFIPLLMLAPLLMANSPVQRIAATTYSDFTLEYVSKTEGVIINNQVNNSYNYSVTNTGTGYIESIHLNYEGLVNGYMNLTSLVFSGNLLIAPNETKVLSFYDTTDYDFNGYNLLSEGLAYQEFVDNAFMSNKKEIVLENDYYDQSIKYVYVYFDPSESLDYNNNLYGVIIDFTYQGEHYSIFERTSGKESIYLGSSENIDVNDLVIDKLTMAKCPRIHSHLGEVLYGIVIFFIVCLAILLSGLIFVIIFFSIKRAKRRKRMLNS